LPNQFLFSRLGINFVFQEEAIEIYFSDLSSAGGFKTRPYEFKDRAKAGAQTDPDNDPI
jgi:hypothetical protein